MKSDDICKLVELHYAGDDDGFTAKLKEVMDAEGQSKHHTVAWEMRMAMNHGLEIRQNPRRWIRLDEYDRNNSDVAEKIAPKFSPEDLILSDEIQRKVDRIVNEHAYLDKLRLHGLDCRRKILLHGPSGTGKTMTGGVIAARLHMDYYVARTDGLIDSKLGESAKRIRQLFQQIKVWPGVYLLDEFDSLGASRVGSNGYDVAEMRRIANELLQLIEQDTSSSIILCATNLRNILDFALFRRFDDIIEYGNPDKVQRCALIKRLTNQEFSDFVVPDGINRLDALIRLDDECKGLSYANIKAAVLDTMKDAVLKDKTKEDGSIIIDTVELIKNVKRRKEEVEFSNAPSKKVDGAVENLALRREMVSSGTKQEKNDGQSEAVS